MQKVLVIPTYTNLPLILSSMFFLAMTESQCVPTFDFTDTHTSHMSREKMSLAP